MSSSHFLLRAPRMNLVYEPCESGFWAHPDFRWGLAPDEADSTGFFQDAGFELTTRDHPDDSIEASCRGWIPEALGDGWFLVLVLDTEDGPQAVFARTICTKELNHD